MLVYIYYYLSRKQLFFVCFPPFSKYLEKQFILNLLHLYPKDIIHSLKKYIIDARRYFTIIFYDLQTKLYRPTRNVDYTIYRHHQHNNNKTMAIKVKVCEWMCIYVFIYRHNILSIFFYACNNFLSFKHVYRYSSDTFYGFCESYFIKWLDFFSEERVWVCAWEKSFDVRFWVVVKQNFN